LALANPLHLLLLPVRKSTCNECIGAAVIPREKVRWLSWLNWLDDLWPGECLSVEVVRLNLGLTDFKAKEIIGLSR
jgi:hypothetical protein